MKRKGLKCYMSDETAVVALTEDLVLAYQDRVRKLMSFRGYKIKDGQYPHFMKVALHFEGDPTFDPELLITAAFSVTWYMKGKPLSRPLPFHLHYQDTYSTYTMLFKRGLREGRKEERIEKAIRNTLSTIKRLVGRNPMNSLSSAHVLEALRGGLITEYYIALIPQLRKQMDRCLMEAILDTDPLAKDTWSLLLDKVREAEFTMNNLGITGNMRNLLVKAGILDV